ncbi:hypothetical protein RhiirA4_478639 [Rhizophagus irregularis]|uniref:Uncharacterized protein n=1 Tax=Rhizophagus irregularis TaxID=588596 RepID=A0A2I1HF71_9GLOM|nr:hypothetical protein RhiirA4_478639 [Rhizophagus irregularis]
MNVGIGKVLCDIKEPEVSSNIEEIEESGTEEFEISSIEEFEGVTPRNLKTNYIKKIILNNI